MREGWGIFEVQHTPSAHAPAVGHSRPQIRPRPPSPYCQAASTPARKLTSEQVQIPL